MDNQMEQRSLTCEEKREVDEAANSLLNQMDMACTTILLNLDKPQSCKRKVNHRRFIQKRLVRLAGKKTRSLKTSQDQKQHKTRSVACAIKRGIARRAQHAPVTLRTLPSLPREPIRSFESVGVPSPASVPSPGYKHGSETGLLFKRGLAQSLDINWPDEDRTRSPTSFSEGSDEVFSPRSALSPSPSLLSSARDDLSTISDNTFSLPSSPFGVTQAASLLTEGWNSRPYPPRLHHIDFSEHDMATFRSAPQTCLSRLSGSDHRMARQWRPCACCDGSQISSPNSWVTPFPAKTEPLFSHPVMMDTRKAYSAPHGILQGVLQSC